MNRIKAGFVLAILFVGSIMPIQKAEAQENKLKRYPVESGIIEFNYEGLQNGKETIYFDRWGMREAKYLDVKVGMMNFTRKHKTMTLMDGDSLFTFDYSTGKATRIKTPLLPELKERNTTNEELDQIGYKMMKDMGGKIVGTEVIAGKKCDIWDIPSALSKAWLWKSITLKTEAGSGATKIIQTAVSFEENPAIPESKFKLPEGAEPQEAPSLEDIQKMMQGNR